MVSNTDAEIKRPQAWHGTHLDVVRIAMLEIHKLSRHKDLVSRYAECSLDHARDKL